MAIIFGTTRVAVVCGGRRYGETMLAKGIINPDADRQRRRLRSVMDAAVVRLGIEAIVQGAATGADYYAEQWAQDRKFPVGSFPAQWDEHGKRAGSIRNAEMLKEAQPCVVVAFKGGVGTAHMCRIAEAAGVRVIKVDWE